MLMKLQMQSVHFDADQKLLSFIQKKADKLDTFFDKIIDGEVVMKVTPDESKINKLIEVKLRIPGILLFAKHQGKTFEEATDLAMETMKSQLRKHKEKKIKG